MQNWVTPVTLKSELITLRQLEPGDKEQLLAAAKDGNLSDLWFTGVPNESSIDNVLAKAFGALQSGEEFPFVVVHNSTGKIIGSSRYCQIDSINRRLEIGYTWYAKSFQKTDVNTQAKLLLLQHAFEALNAIAVEFQTHWFNFNSRQAILRLGAKQDGVRRNHRIMPDGSFRDTVIFSIIQSEWLGVKANLEFKLKQHNK
ncbi:GNAT family N-acetyltransferase [Aliikangiella maris]|uniref:GNAT family protein n=2 Tax=Aliikangiella maris TaxID=3162458 RepID=A0ABV2BPW2_9GAMM